MLIAILYNVTRDWDRVDIDSVMESVVDVQETLKSLGHQALPVSLIDGPASLIDQLLRRKPELVFNLCEGVGNTSAGEIWVAGLLELLGIPYTGSGPLALGLALEKPLAKRLFLASGLPTPAFAVYTQAPIAPPTLRYPLILKLAGEDASLGITGENVVADQSSCLSRLHQLLAEYNAPVMVEEFIDGREFTVPILDGRPIALEEIEFDVEPRIVCHHAKWDQGSPEDVGTRPNFNPDVAGSERDEMFDLARRTWNLIGMRDYGRVDFRMDSQGRLFILEANPNPDISPNAGYRRALDVARIPFAGFVGGLLENARRRGRPADRSTPAPHE